MSGQTLIKAVDSDRGTNEGEGLKKWRSYLKSTIAVRVSLTLFFIHQVKEAYTP